MKIKSKFQIGDIVFYINSHKIKSSNILGIRTTYTDTIEYTFEKTSTWTTYAPFEWIGESLVAATREELIESL
jgi:hypothetical protein